MTFRLDRRLAVIAMCTFAGAAWAGDAPVVSDAWARATPPGTTVGAAYMTIQGGKQADRLVGASSDRPAMTHLHAVDEQDGVAKMRAIDADKTKLEAARTLAEQGIRAGPSNVAEDLAADPHVALRDMLIEVPRPDDEKPYLVSGNPVKMSRLAEGPVAPAPRLGAHTEALLRELIGADDAELTRLRAEGAIP